ncbi:MAG: ATP-binding protein [Myxococcales bacterium]|nr:ATP-binding protein [Myxococcales bacterium]
MSAPGAADGPDRDLAPAPAESQEPASGSQTIRPAASTLAARSTALLRLGLLRLSVASALLGAALWLTYEPKVGLTSFTTQGLLALLGGAHLIAYISIGWLRTGANPEAASGVHTIAELVVTTGLVYLTGGAGSVFSILYGIAILMAAMTSGPRASAATGLFTLLLYNSLTICLAMGWLPAPPDQDPRHYLLADSALAFALLSHTMGLSLVTVLAGVLAERLRLTGGALEVAERSVASLTRLHADIVRSVSAGLMTTDLEGRVQTVNPMTVSLLGRSAEELEGQMASALLPLELPPIPARPTRCAGQAQGADGTPIEVGCTVAPLLAEDHRIEGSVISFQDVTEIRRLRRSAEAAERHAVLGRLATGLAHEIRNPLGSISGSVQLVSGAAGLDAQDRRLLEIVVSEVDRLDDLVETMLQVGRPRELRVRAFDLSAMVSETLEMARRSNVPGADIRFEFEPPAAELPSRGDPDLLRQVLWNLLKNAAQASPPGGRVQVSATLRAEGGFRLEIADEGPGIPEHERERVFDVFRSGRKHGVGLGLALVRQIVEAHGGRIEIARAAGGGAVFRIDLP